MNANQSNFSDITCTVTAFPIKLEYVTLATIFYQYVSTNSFLHLVLKHANQ